MWTLNTGKIKMTKDFVKRIADISKEEFMRRVELILNAMHEVEVEKDRIFKEHYPNRTLDKLSKEDPTYESYESFKKKMDKELATNIVLCKISNVCLQCKGEKDFNDNLELCKSCREILNDNYFHMVKGDKKDKEYLSKMLSLHFKNDTFSPKEKEDLIKDWGLDL